ncbi:MAG: HD domain-containing protein [Armatimonadetes bacterium]|nr:HD domain-containing protein [Armatimonadota bacterium]
MDKGYNISDLSEGTVFADALFRVRTVTPRQEGTKQPKLKLTLTDGTGSCAATLWEVPDALARDLLCGATRYVRVSGTVQSGKYAGDVQVSTLVAAPEPTDLTPFLPRLAPGHGDFQKRFNALVGSVGFPPLFALLKQLFQPHLKPFHAAFAAQSRHHAYPGGLLQHTVEVAEMCQKACAVYPELKHDLLLCGALLHDFGKLTELDSCGDYTETGRLIGHIGEGAYRIRRAAEDTPGLPPTLMQELIHLILSHHGLLEHGSPIKPATPEAHVLTHCDNISAKMASHREAAEKLGKAGGRYSRVGSETIYVSDATVQNLDLSGKNVRLDASVADPLQTPPITGTVRLPLLGWVAAGSAGQGSESADEFCDVVMPPGGADFLLRVVGDSMTGAGIFERDLLFVRKMDNDPRPGQIVVASLPDGASAVVKRFSLDAANGAPCLISENKGYATIPVTEEVRIQGLVVHLQREMG